MTIIERNEAAERLRAAIVAQGYANAANLLDAALAAERRLAETEARRATVERIRARLPWERIPGQVGNAVAAVLAEEAAR